MSLTTCDAEKSSICDLYSFKHSETVDWVFVLGYVEKRLTRDYKNSPSVVLETRKAIQYFLDADAEFIGFGSTRICFLNRAGRVIKIPFRRFGYDASLLEVHTYENFMSKPEEGWTPTAECWFVKVDGIDVWLLSMERIQTFSRRGKVLPDWVSTVDCGQVGYNSVGELVAYDL